MRYVLVALAFLVTATFSASLGDVCTNSYAQVALPYNAYPGIAIDSSSVTASASYNVPVTSAMYPDAIIDYCSVTFAYSHSGQDDRVLVNYWLPSPDKFANRFLATGGGGWAINSGIYSVAGGIPYGAAAGLTDGGFGGFENTFDSVFLLANNTINWNAVHMFGFQAIYEMTVLGKAFTSEFFGSGDTKLHTYYQGCSEGGREGFSQVQRFADTYDAAIIGAPAFRYSFQQANHLTSNIVEKTFDYFSPPCELQQIVYEMIAACDPLDGRIDGVVDRTDLCKLTFDLNSVIGKPYYCAATDSGPAQSGIVSAQCVAVAREILKGLQDNKGRQVYVPYQYTSAFADAQTAFNGATGYWELSQSGFGGEWAERFLLLQNAYALPSLDGVTYDTLRDWMILGLEKYAYDLQTTWTDLTPWRNAGNKIIHYHGESDFSIPTASSVRYRESVRETMYPGLSYNESSNELNQWYKYFSIPGAAHCSPNDQQPNGPWPQTNLQVMIDWVEYGIEPVTLNATVLQGDQYGQNRQICAWPLRPYWYSDGTELHCFYDQASLDSWNYDLNGVNITVS